VADNLGHMGYTGWIAIKWPLRKSLVLVALGLATCKGPVSVAPSGPTNGKLSLLVLIWAQHNGTSWAPWLGHCGSLLHFP